MATVLPASIDSLKKIIETGQATRIRWPNTVKSTLCDTFTAGAIVAVYNAINDDNKKKYADMIARNVEGFGKAAGFAFKHTK